MIWGWLTPLFFLFLAAVPVLLLVYLFRRKAKVFFTSALFLWGSSSGEARGAPRFRLMRPPLAFFLLASALILLACAGASLFTMGKDRFPPAAVILNNSYAMTPAVRQRAKKMLVRYLKSFPGRRVIWFRSGAVPEALNVRGPDPDLKALWSGDEPEFQAERAIALARMHSPGSEIIVVTDRPLPRELPGVTCLSAGIPGPNLAIVNARCAYGRALIEVQNFSGIPLDSELRAGNFLRRRFTIEGGGRKLFRFNCPDAASPVTVALKTPGDLLPFDNTAWLLPEDTTPVSYALKELPAPAERALELALRNNPEFRPCGKTTVPEVLFTENPKNGAGKSKVIFHQGKTVAGDELAPALENHSPLARGLATAGLSWGRFRGITLPGRGILFSSQAPVISEEKTGPVSCRIHFNLSFPHSNVTSLPFWPGLFCNLAARFRALRPGPEHRMYHAGDTLVFRTVKSEEKVICEGPEGRSEVTGTGGKIVLKVNRPGLYRFSGSAGTGQAAVNPAVTALSDLTLCRTALRRCRLEELELGQSRRLWTMFFIAGALALLMLEQFLAAGKKS